MVLMACQTCFRFDIAGMKRTIFFVTGTDTGVGKTVLTALVTRYLHNRGINVAALKPICSGGRSDARVLYAELDGALTLDEINPWHFRAPIAPVLAARRESKKIKLPQVVVYLHAMQKRFDVVLIEGAGGLLSPLGEDFDSRDLIAAMCAEPIIVCPNRLGAVNQVLLTHEALPRAQAAKAWVVLMSPPKADTSTTINAGLLAEHFDRKRIFSLPWLGRRVDLARGLKNSQVRRTLQKLAPAV